jgi:hypothetical protein
MRMMVKGVFIGGVVGAVVVVAKSMQSDEPNDVVASKLARTAGGAAVAGGVVGLVLDGRARRRARRRSRLAGVSAAGLRDAAVKAAEAARPHVELAAERTRDVALRAAEAARPQLEHAAVVARGQAGRMAEAARPRLAELAERVDVPTLVVVR